MKSTLAVLALVLSLGFNVRADLPENTLNLEDGSFKADSSMTEEQFNAIADYVKLKMVGYVHKHHAWLQVQKKWNDSTVNAYATEIGPLWTVVMFGGLARRPEVTPDAFALVMCHELGHHLGGFPFYPSIFGGSWAATEGEADYFGSQVCAKEIWSDDVMGNADAAKSVDGFAKSRCDAVYHNTKDQNLCYRTSMAGLSLATLLTAIRQNNAATAGQSSETIKMPDFKTPDTSKVVKTYPGHPQGQCRLDTYFAGALCDAKFDLNLIPARNIWLGRNSARAEEVAARYSCTSKTHSVGLRPNCWFSNRF